MDWDSRRLRRTSNGDRDVEREVVRAVSGDIHATLNTANRGREQADQLNLTVEGDYAPLGVQCRLDGLAHVTKNDGARSVRLTDEDGKLRRTSRSHITRRVVANNVVGRRSKIERNGSSVCDDGGGVVEHAVGLNLTNETLNR